MAFRFRLKHILFLIFTVIASLPVLLLAVWVEESALEKEVAMVEEKHLLVAKNLTGDLERYVTDVQSSFNFITSNLVANNSLLAVPKYMDSLFLRCVVITDNSYAIRQQVVGTSQAPIHEFNPQTRKRLPGLFDEARKVHGAIVFSDLVKRPDGETVFYLVKALKNGQFALGLLSTRHILHAQKKVTFGRRGHAAIVDRTGRAIAHPVKSWIAEMKDMSFLPPVKAMMQGETGVSKFYTPAMKADMVAGYTVVPNVGWGVMIPQPFEELQERAEDVKLIALAIAIGGIIISALLSWLVAGRLSDPVQAVVEAAKTDAHSKDDDLKLVHTRWRFIPEELRILIRSFNAMRTRLSEQTSQLYLEIDNTHKEIELRNDLLYKQSLELLDANQKLKKTNVQLEVMNCTDSLTGLYNRRHFDETLEKEFSYSKRHKKTFSLIMIDIDYFKMINDEYGHAAGDHVLLEIASLIIRSVRRSDVICRVGGEEFAIICRETNLENVRKQAEKLREIIERHKVVYSGKEIFVTASFGSSSCQPDITEDCKASDMYKQADMAMYYSKKNGRNRSSHYLDIDEVSRKRGKL